MTAVRFRRPKVEGHSWRYGRFAKGHPIETSKIVAIVDEWSGGTYMIDKKYVQVEARGPRGGKRWEAM